MIAQSLSPLPSGLKISPIALTKQWQVGQILNAVVGKAHHTNLFDVRIDNQNLKASGPPGMREGDLLQLKVIEAETRVLFKIISHNKAELKSGGAEQQLRLDLPKQKSILDLVETMIRLKNSGDQSSNRTILSANIQRQIAEYVNLLPGLKQLGQHQILKQNIVNSGLFLENKLMQVAGNKSSLLNSVPAASIKTDLKASLLRIEQAIQSEVTVAKDQILTPVKLALVSKSSQNVPIPQQTKPIDENPEIQLSTLKNAVQAAISKVQVNQAQTIINNEHSMPQWLIDLPFLHNKRAGLLELIVQQEKSRDEETSHADKWTVSFNLSLESLGKITVQLSLSDNNLSSTIWAENPGTNQQINKNLLSLDARLQRAGLNVVALEQHPLTPARSGLELRSSSLIKAEI